MKFVIEASKTKGGLRDIKFFFNTLQHQRKRHKSEIAKSHINEIWGFISMCADKKSYLVQIYQDSVLLLQRKIKVYSCSGFQNQLEFSL